MSKRRNELVNIALGRTQPEQPPEPEQEQTKRKQPYKRSVVPSAEQIELWDKAVAHLKAQGIEANFNQFALWAIDYVAERVLSGELEPPVTVERKLGR
jgi:hypothetical protein